MKKLFLLLLALGMMSCVPFVKTIVAGDYPLADEYLVKTECLPDDQVIENLLPVIDLVLGELRDYFDIETVFEPKDIVFADYFHFAALRVVIGNSGEEVMTMLLFVRGLDGNSDWQFHSAIPVRNWRLE
jgi:hypothetical protein